jgi:hypothetical protein
MIFLRKLADVDVLCAERQRRGHRLLLVLQGRTRQIEVHPVLAELPPLGGKEADSKPGVITG